MGVRAVRPNSPVASTNLSGAQLLFGLPSTRPPRPAAKVMIALPGGGFRRGRAGEGPPPVGRPADDDVLRHDAIFGRQVIDDPEVNLRDRKAGSAEVGIAALSDLREKRAVDSMLRYVDGRCAVSAADGGHHEIAALGKPLGGVPKFHKREKAADGRIH